MPAPETATSLFEDERPRLVRLAYRMLGSLGEAEDVVQDAWMRWRLVDQATVNSPPAYLSRTVTRLCLDVMKSARARRETYFGTWLPEPVAMVPDEGPGDDLTLTLMLALERLSPLERAAFLLHDVFGVPLDEVADALDRETTAVRQLAVRARSHISAARPRYPVARDEADRLARAFYTASNQGDLAGLRVLLTENVVLQADGGGKAHAFLRPIVGQDKVVRLYGGLYRKLTKAPSVLVRWAWIDGLPGFV